MPISALKQCNHPGCSKLVRGSGRCDDHKAVSRQLSDSHRGSSASRGYGYKWQKARQGYLKNHPYCVECEKQRIVERSTVVDHKVPHKLKEANDSGVTQLIDKAKQLFWDKSNWQALCKSCHDKKTARQDGGFGRVGAGKKSTAFIS